MYLLLHEEQLLLCVDDNTPFAFGEILKLLAKPPVFAHEVLEGILRHF